MWLCGGGVGLNDTLRPFLNNFDLNFGAQCDNVSHINGVLDKESEIQRSLSEIFKVCVNIIIIIICINFEKSLMAIILIIFISIVLSR